MPIGFASKLPPLRNASVILKPRILLRTDCGAPFCQRLLKAIVMTRKLLRQLRWKAKPYHSRGGAHD